MLKKLHTRRNIQLWLGLCAGIVFGFLIHKGGITRYDTILEQLLLQDFTMVKIILSAVITGMIGIHFMKDLGVVAYHLKSGSIGITVIGGLIFGVGFAILGYCPGTLVGAVGSGYLDAFIGGVPGMLIGAWLFSLVYSRLNRIFLLGRIGNITFPRLLKVNAWIIVIPFICVLLAILYVIEVRL